eukprot:TRINITY_DN64104_c0_g1_i1.p1 TRINITY_DN64104_c0_g1~~TRINITY_DN64104_c0_g1_i1.p1  ORF type:complete len:114 (-),score=25.34 TRINITY_DN64104_c0_g1_i1:35-376(-)
MAVTWLRLLGCMLACSAAIVSGDRGIDTSLKDPPAAGGALLEESSNSQATDDERELTELSVVSDERDQDEGYFDGEFEGDWDGDFEGDFEGSFRGDFKGSFSSHSHGGHHHES